MEEHQSVTIWLRQLALGDQEAARKLWERYGQDLIELSRRRFRGVFGAFEDEEDLVQSVFRALWTGATDGRLTDVKDREQLWWLLLAITKRKALNRHAFNTRLKRAQDVVSLNGDPSEPGALTPEDRLADKRQAPADLILILSEQQERLLDLLGNETLRSIAMWKLDGHTHDDIALKLDVAPRTVVRKVNLIRGIWTQELKS